MGRRKKDTSITTGGVVTGTLSNESFEDIEPAVLEVKEADIQEVPENEEVQEEIKEEDIVIVSDPVEAKLEAVKKEALPDASKEVPEVKPEEPVVQEPVKVSLLDTRLEAILKNYVDHDKVYIGKNGGIYLESPMLKYVDGLKEVVNPFYQG